MVFLSLHANAGIIPGKWAIHAFFICKSSFITISTLNVLQYDSEMIKQQRC
jgi:hypothetical protein